MLSQKIYNATRKSFTQSFFHAAVAEWLRRETGDLVPRMRSAGSNPARGVISFFHYKVITAR